MTIKKLSKIQSETLARMKYNIWYCAYEMGVSMATLNALYRLNLLDRRSEAGAFYSPRTSVEFRRKK